MSILDRLSLWLAGRRQAKFERWCKRQRVRMPAPDRTWSKNKSFKKDSVVTINGTDWVVTGEVGVVSACQPSHPSRG